jgi:hypothetical protein
MPYNRLLRKSGNKDRELNKRAEGYECFPPLNYRKFNAFYRLYFKPHPYRSFLPPAETVILAPFNGCE